MAENNALGKYIRNMRREKNFDNLTDFARKLHHSVSYLSRVERGTADGPSLKVLNEIAYALNVDVKHLVQLKEQDNVGKTQGTHDKETGKKSDGDWKSKRLDAREELHPGLGTHYAAMPLAERRRGSISPGKDLEIDRIGLRPDYEALAAIYFSIAEKYLANHQAAECLDTLALALTINERLGNQGGVAFSYHNIGRGERQQAYDPVLSQSEKLHHLLEASYSFNRAYAIFTAHLEQLPDKYRGRRPESTAQSARTDELIAKQLAFPDADESGEFDNDIAESLRNDYKENAQAFYQSRAQAKREAAIRQYDEWIKFILERKKRGSINKEEDGSLLADAYQRLGVVHRDLAASLPSAAYAAESVKVFELALEQRLEQVSGCKDSPQHIEEYLDRLANTHGEFGLSLQLYSGVGCDGMDKSSLREEAYWQFKIAEKLYNLLHLHETDSRVKFIDAHLVSIQTQEGLESDIISRQRIEDDLTKLQFGPVSHPTLNYSLVYTPNAKKLAGGKSAEA